QQETRSTLGPVSPMRQLILRLASESTSQLMLATHGRISPRTQMSRLGPALTALAPLGSAGFRQHPRIAARLSTDGLSRRSLSIQIIRARFTLAPLVLYAELALS